MSEWLHLNLGQLVHFHFLRPWWLLALIPMLFSLRHLWRANDPMGKWRKVVAPHLLKVMLVSHGRASWFNPVTVAVLIVVLAVIAMAGPTWKQQASPFSEDIAALVIALDVSSSMQQSDVQPSRLERAKQKVQDLLLLRPGGRVGLIVYSGTAHSVIPLTNDADVVNNYLSAIDTKMMPRKGKFPEKALPIADRMLRDSPVPGTVLLIADGISPETNTDFQQYFSANHHQLLILGVGRESVDGDEEDTALIPLEYHALEKLASENGGFYQSLTLDKEDVQRLNRRINNYLVIVDDGSRPWVDSGYFLLFPIGLILLLWFRKGWTLNWCIALLVVSGLTSPRPVMASESGLADRFMDLWLTPDQQGRYYLQKGDYKTAAIKFESIAWRGIAYYRDENFKAAVEMFSRIESVQGYFNMANSLAHGRSYLSAVKAYNKVLELDPDNASALKNRDKIQEIIDEMNMLAESQTQDMEEGDTSKQLGDDEPQSSDGAEVKDFVKHEVKQLTAEQILLDEKMNGLWMRQVQKSPAHFLRVKFQMQLLDEKPLE